jgi:hypothetical protein
MCTFVFIAALLTVAMLWNQPRYPSMNKWIKEMWFVCIYIYIYTMKFYSVIKKNKIMSFAGKWMELEMIMLSEISQTQKDKYHILFHMWNRDF